MKKYKLIIFDMDGTILNTIDDINGAVNACLNKYGYPPKTVDETKLAVGNGLRLTLIRSLPAEYRKAILENNDYNTGDMSQEKFEEMLGYFLEYYGKHSAEKTGPYPGITETIEEIKEKGYLTAVVSNKRNDAVQDLCLQFYDGLFDVALGETSGINPKPAPDSVFMVMEKLKTSPEEVVYIGDSDVDIATAKNAGIDCIAVAWGFRTREFLKANGAIVIIDKPEEILDLL